MNAHAARVEANCICGKVFHPRKSDVDRGWGKFCSKSCKAKNQTRLTGISGPHYKAKGQTVGQMGNGKFAKSKFKRGEGRTGYRTIVAYDEWDDEVIEGDVVWSERHRCWVDFREGAEDHPFDSDAAGFNNT